MKLHGWTNIADVDILDEEGDDVLEIDTYNQINKNYVGSHMKNLAKNRQIFCITHLASIAVYADNQVKIEKGVVSGKTSSVARNIDGEERVEEIARMLSGDANTQQSLDHARAMLLKYSGGN